MAFFESARIGRFISTYRAAYSMQLDWGEIFDEEIFEWLSIFEKGKNCSLKELLRLDRKNAPKSAHKITF